MRDTVEIYVGDDDDCVCVCLSSIIRKSIFITAATQIRCQKVSCQIYSRCDFNKSPENKYGMHFGGYN